MTKNWKRFEQLVAKDVNGRVQPGSGRFPGTEEDVICQLLLIQCKSSKNSSPVATVEELVKLAERAERMGRDPVWAAAPNFTAGTRQYYAMVPTYILEHLDLFDLLEPSDIKIDLTTGTTKNFPAPAMTGELLMGAVKCHGGIWGHAVAFLPRQEFIEFVEEITNEYNS